MSNPETEKDKTAGKFAWFCVGAWLGTRGISRLMHTIYIAIILLLLAANALQAPDTIKQLTSCEEQVTDTKE